jgi:hypothetical protein
MENKNSIKCDICGRFMSYDSLELGLATHIMVTPDSDVSYETFESYHHACKKKELEKYGK